MARVPVHENEAEGASELRRELLEGPARRIAMDSGAAMPLGSASAALLARQLESTPGDETMIVVVEGAST